jgi:hypothetical protein
MTGWAGRGVVSGHFPHLASGLWINDPWTRTVFYIYWSACRGTRIALHLSEGLSGLF